MTDAVAELIRDAQRITALTGAGISTESGIPDFRGPNGVWTRDPKAERLATLDVYLGDPEVRREAWAKRLAHEAWVAKPNAGHLALVDLERTGRLRALITQNVDGLHQRAGSSDDVVIEIHGTIWLAECMTCWVKWPMESILDRVRAGEADPPCELCGGIVKSATISFGQALKEDVIQACIDAAADCDLFLAVGTSLTVHPAAGLCDVAVSAGARLVIVNAQATPYDDIADALIGDPIGEVLPRLMSD
jgi:NAD-dependent deacetylase